MDGKKMVISSEEFPPPVSSPPFGTTPPLDLQRLPPNLGAAAGAEFVLLPGVMRVTAFSVGGTLRKLQRGRWSRY